MAYAFGYSVNTGYLPHPWGCGKKPSLDAQWVRCVDSSGDTACLSLDCGSGLPREAEFLFISPPLNHASAVEQY